jgi:hypothetical protein
MLGRIVATAAFGLYTLWMMIYVSRLPRTYCTDEPQKGRHRAFPYVQVFTWMGIWELSCGSMLIYLGSAVSSAITLIMLGLGMLAGPRMARKINRRLADLEAHVVQDTRP